MNTISPSARWSIRACLVALAATGLMAGCDLTDPDSPARIRRRAA